VVVADMAVGEMHLIKVMEAATAVVVDMVAAAAVVTAAVAVADMVVAVVVAAMEVDTLEVVAATTRETAYRNKTIDW